MKSLAIFDLDGTLLNTIDDLGEAANHALSTLGYPTHHLSVYPHFVGNGITKLLERAAPSDARDPQSIEQLRNIFVKYYDEHLCDRTRPYEGIPELLRQLSDAGIDLAVASNKYQHATHRLITHFFGDFHWVAIEGQREGVPVKPDPSIVFDILNRRPTPKTDVIYIGDSAVDIVTARRAGVESVGVTWGFRGEAELYDAGADNIVHSPAAILPIATRTSPIIGI